jgi:hypothetical protein
MSLSSDQYARPRFSLSRRICVHVCVCVCVCLPLYLFLRLCLCECVCLRQIMYLSKHAGTPARMPGCCFQAGSAVYHQSARCHVTNGASNTLQVLSQKCAMRGLRTSRHALLRHESILKLLCVQAVCLIGLREDASQAITAGLTCAQPGGASWRKLSVLSKLTSAGKPLGRSVSAVVGTPLAPPQ